MKSLRKQYGFTLIELMIATSIFSLVLLMVAAGSIQIGKLFYKGYSSARAQNAAREIIDDITRVIQFGANDPTPWPIATQNLAARAGSTADMPVSYFCIDTTRYSFIVDARNAAQGGYNEKNPNDKLAPHVLWRDTIPSAADCTGPADLQCPDPNKAGCGFPTGTKGQELVPFNMKLTEFFLQEAPTSTGSRYWCLRVGVAHGEDDIQVRGNTQDCLGATVPNRVIRCVESSKGGQFCAISKLQTTIFRRLE